MNPLDEETAEQAENLFETLLAAATSSPAILTQMLGNNPVTNEASTRRIAAFSIRAAIIFREEVAKVRDDE